MQKNKNTLKENFQTMYSLTDANIMRCLFLRCSFDLLSRQIHLCQKKGNCRTCWAHCVVMGDSEDRVSEKHHASALSCVNTRQVPEVSRWVTRDPEFPIPS